MFGTSRPPPGRTEPVTTPEGFEDPVMLVHLMMGGLVRPFSWDEWQELDYTFAKKVMVALPVVQDVARYKAGGQ